MHLQPREVLAEALLMLKECPLHLENLQVVYVGLDVLDFVPEARAPARKFGPTA